MNKRIEHLFNKAGFHKPEMERLGIEHKFEKFAELIVRECCEQIKICSEQIKNDEGYADDNLWPIFKSIVDAVEIDVKEHFGVE